ncbi:MAG: sensor histidine kinase, partial [Dehalococcoidia bacterium]|nr:sensor histidine kinase [Dehalococcoidia bacterium]
SRHSEASEAKIALEHQEGELRMTIVDDGKGFELPTQLSDFAGQGKLGLTGMEERVRLVGGKFEASSQIGEGTMIVVRVPTKLFDESDG